MEINVEKIKSGLDKAAVSTVRATGKVMNVTKLKFRKAELKGKIEDEYKKLGKLVYEGSEELDITEKLEQIKATLDEYTKALEECSAELEAE